MSLTGQEGKMRRLLSILVVSVTLLHVTYLYAQHDHEHSHDMGKTAMHQESEDFGICPVMRGKASKDYSYVYEGKTYYFCCPSCVEEFKSDPEKYISKIKEVNLEAYQFGFVPDPIIVKKDDIVKFSITSRDVPHGVYIKEYGINVSVKKGEIKKIEFIADKEGEFYILCSVYCGSGHSQMKGRFIVER